MDTLLQQVQTIALNSTKYGKDLNERLSTIDDNFTKIIQSDFLRGYQGENLYLYKVDLLSSTNNITTEETDISDPVKIYINGELKDATSNELYNAIKESIEYRYGRDEEKSELNAVKINYKTINWYDDLDGSTLYFVYKENQNDKSKIIISSLPFTYIDSRFKKVPSEGNGVYNGLTDISGTIIYNNDKFDLLQNAPTLYYDENIEDGAFCWKINGNQTGIPAQGPQGDKGIDGKIWIAQCELNSELKLGDPVNITALYLEDKTTISDNGQYLYKWKPKSEIEEDDILNMEIGQSIICCGSYMDGKESKTIIFISYIQNFEKGKIQSLGVPYNESWNIDGVTKSLNLEESLKNLKSGGSYPGLFLSMVTQEVEVLCPLKNSHIIKPQKPSGIDLGIDSELYLGPISDGLIKKESTSIKIDYPTIKLEGNIPNANINNANINNVDIGEARIGEANITNASVDVAGINEADISEAIINDSVYLPLVVTSAPENDKWDPKEDSVSGNIPRFIFKPYDDGNNEYNRYAQGFYFGRPKNDGYPKGRLKLSFDTINMDGTVKVLGTLNTKSLTVERSYAQNFKDSYVVELDNSQTPIELEANLASTKNRIINIEQSDDVSAEIALDLSLQLDSEKYANDNSIYDVYETNIFIHHKKGIDGNGISLSGLKYRIDNGDPKDIDANLRNVYIFQSKPMEELDTDTYYYSEHAQINIVSTGEFIIVKIYPGGYISDNKDMKYIHFDTTINMTSSQS